MIIFLQHLLQHSEFSSQHCKDQYKIVDCHESYPACRGERHAPSPADRPHAEADRADFQPAVSLLPDRSAAPGAGNRRGDPEPQLPAAPHRGDLRRRRRPRHEAALRRRAHPARHGGRGPVCRGLADRVGRRLQWRRADPGRPARRPGAPSRAQGEGDDCPDAGREPARLRPGRNRRERQHSALSREAGRGRDHLQHDQRRHLHPRAGHVRPHSQGHGLVDRAELLSVAHRARRDVCRLRLRRLLDRHRDAGEIPPGAPRHHGRSLFGAAV